MPSSDGPLLRSSAQPSHCTVAAVTTVPAARILSYKRIGGSYLPPETTDINDQFQRILQKLLVGSLKSLISLTIFAQHTLLTDAQTDGPRYVKTLTLCNSSYVP